MAGLRYVGGIKGAVDRAVAIVCWLVYKEKYVCYGNVCQGISGLPKVLYVVLFKVRSFKYCDL